MSLRCLTSEHPRFLGVRDRGMLTAARLRDDDGRDPAVGLVVRATAELVLAVQACYGAWPLRVRADIGVW